MKIQMGSQLVFPTTCLAALAIAAAGCSGSNPGSDGTAIAGDPGGGPAVSNGAGGASNVTPGAGGSVNPAPSSTPSGSGGGAPVGAGGALIAAGGATGIAGSSPSTGAGGESGAAGAAATGGASGDPPGCAQGTFCQAGDDLSPPDAAKGFQLVSPSTVILQPGEEQFLCYYKNVPVTADVNIGAFRSWMTKGSSHHFITYLLGSGGSPLGGGKQADGALVPCGGAAGQWIYATSQSGMVVGMDMPETVGLPLSTSSQLVMNMHFVNTKTEPLTPQVKLNVLYADNVQYKAAAMISFNTQINVPPGGTQTVRGTCTPPAGSNFFVMSTHTHKWATAADVNYVSGGQTTNIVHTTDFEQPGTHTWQAPNFLTTKAGDTFTYSCEFRNTETFAITVGETAQRNEMCMAIGYYFPAGNASCR